MDFTRIRYYRPLIVTTFGVGSAPLARTHRHIWAIFMQRCADTLFVNSRRLLYGCLLKFCGEKF